MFSYWAYILIGRNDTGKTHFQRYLISHLCELRYDRLPRNVVNDIKHERAPKGLQTLFTMNRSYQEKKSMYKSIKNFFTHKDLFKEADVCILSSHPAADDISQMIQHLRRRCYNVAGVFWSNSYGSETEAIAELPWDEVLWVENPILRDDNAIRTQLDRLASHFSQFLITRAHSQ
jgi:hypothetical protein